MSHPSLQRGLTFLEVLLVIAILGILTVLIIATVDSSRQKAVDTRIRNNVSQLRILAEVAYDASGGSYVNWSQEPSVLDDVTRLRELIDEHNGDPAGAPYVSILRETQSQDFCASAPLTAEAGSNYCVDASGEFYITTAICPDYGDDASGDPPLRCP